MIPFPIARQQSTGTVPSPAHPKSALSPRAGLRSLYLCISSSTSTVTPGPGVLPRARREDLPSFGASEKSVAKCSTSIVRDQLQPHVTAKKKPRKSLMLQQQHHLAQLGALTTVKSGLPRTHMHAQNPFTSLLFPFMFYSNSEGKKKSKAILYLDSTSLPNLSKTWCWLELPS